MIWIVGLFEETTQLYRNRMKGVVSKGTVVLGRWGSSTQKFGFINGVDNVNWPPYRDSYGGQFTFISTPLIEPNFCINIELEPENVD